MSGHSAEEVQKHIKLYIGVFIGLAFLTVVTVGVSYLHLSMGMAIAIALLVASIKATLVMTYFMHLISERGMIFTVLGFTFFFFLVCLLIPALTVHDMAYVAGAH